MDPVFETEALMKVYGPRRMVKKVVDNVTITIEPGVTGIVGIEGSGKSALFDMVTGANSPSSGTVKVYGHDLQHERAEAVMLVGAVPTFPVFRRGMSVEETIQCGCRSVGIPKGEIGDATQHVLGRLGLSEKAKMPAMILNTFEHRKLALALALLKDPKALVFDDPYRALKAGEREEMKELIKSMSEGVECTLLMLSTMEEADLCSKVFEIEDGAVSEVSA